MKPFDLERALAGDAVVDGMGNSIERFHLFTGSEHMPLHCLYGVVNNEAIASYTIGGHANTHTQKRNLFMKD